MQKTNNTKQTLWLAFGQLASLLIAVISPMILSRYLTKNDYGTYKQVMYVYSSLLAVFTLGLPKSYSYFIPRVPRTEVKSLINKITTIFLLLGIAFSSFLFLGAPVIAKLLKNPDLVLALKLFSIVPVLLLPTMGLEGVYASFKKTHIVAIYTIASKVITIFLTIIPVIVFNGNYLHAIIGFDIGCLITFWVAIYLKSYPVKEEKHDRTNVGYRQIFAFSLPLLAASLWGMIINASDQFFISRYFGNEVFAEFSNGYMEFPLISMILVSIGTVLIPVFSEYSANKGNNDLLLQIWKSTLNKSIKIIYPIAFFCIFFSTTIMICLYGDMYRNSGMFFAIKNIQALFCVVPFSPLILALGKTKEYSLAHMNTAISVVILELIFVQIYNTATSIAWVSLFCQFLKVILQMTIVIKSLRFSVKELLDIKVILKCISCCMVSCIFLYAINHLFVISNSWICLFFDICIFIGVYYASCFVFKLTYKDICSSITGDHFQKIIKFIP